MAIGRPPSDVDPLDARQGGELRLQLAGEPVGELGDRPLVGREAQVEGGVRPVGPLDLDDRRQGLLRQLGPDLLEPGGDLGQGGGAVVVELEPDVDDADARPGWWSRRSPRR